MCQVSLLLNYSKKNIIVSPIYNTINFSILNALTLTGFFHQLQCFYHLATMPRTSIYYPVLAGALKPQKKLVL